VDTYAGEAIDGYSTNNAQAKKVASPTKDDATLIQLFHTQTTSKEHLLLGASLHQLQKQMLFYVRLRNT